MYIQSSLLPNKQFASSKDGRQWSHKRESQRADSYGDRYMSLCTVSWECHNYHCTHLIQYGKINRHQFTSKGVCKSCGSMSEQGKCSCQKIWGFPSN